MNPSLTTRKLNDHIISVLKIVSKLNSDTFFSICNNNESLETFFKISNNIKNSYSEDSDIIEKQEEQEENEKPYFFYDVDIANNKRVFKLNSSISLLPLSLQSQKIQASEKKEKDTENLSNIKVNITTILEVEKISEKETENKDYHKKNQYFKTRICPWLGQNRCRMGDECRWAHSVTELRPSVDLTHTKLCDSYCKRSECTNPECRFAHTAETLRATTDVYKTSLCSFWAKGICIAGYACRFAHGEEDLRRKMSDDTPLPIEAIPDEKKFNLEDLNKIEHFSDKSDNGVWNLQAEEQFERVRNMSDSNVYSNNQLIQQAISTKNLAQRKSCDNDTFLTSAATNDLNFLIRPCDYVKNNFIHSNSNSSSTIMNSLEETQASTFLPSPSFSSCHNKLQTSDTVNINGTCCFSDDKSLFPLSYKTGYSSSVKEKIFCMDCDDVCSTAKQNMFDDSSTYQSSTAEIFDQSFKINNLYSCWNTDILNDIMLTVSETL